LGESRASLTPMLTGVAENSPPVARRRLGVRPRPLVGVADPSRGTRVAVGLPLVSLALTVAWVVHRGWSLDASLPVVAALLAVSAVAERVVVQLGPRSWYTASTPAIVVAALLGGPFVGVAAAIATQLARGEAVWRRRLAEGGLASIQGLAAGVIGLVAWVDGPSATAVAAAAMATAVAVNSCGRLLVMIERRATPLGRLWLRGVVVDCLEALLMVPLIGALLVTSQTSSVLVVTTMAALLMALTIAQHTRKSTAAALVTEQQNARRDQLTGAPNRRAFEEAMVAEHARVVRGGVAAGLYVVDIDRFKSINDRHGHRVGDEVLVEVMRRLTDGLRPSDLVARWGGEEITILTPGVRGRRQIEHVGERIRMLVGDQPIPTTVAPVDVTVSVGGTLLDGSIAPSAALHHADEALYEAKQTRDSTTVSLPPPLAVHLDNAS
jgi:diguanylate cyclase (GGDEF)-like protein